MRHLFIFIALFFSAVEAMGQKEYPANYARAPRFNALVCYDPYAESAHVDFDKQAIEFIHKLSYGEGFTYKVTTQMEEIGIDSLRKYDVLVWLNFSPGAKGRVTFRRYMEQGGGWVGFHAAAYNDRNTHWPWYNEFLGCGQFLCNNWPPQPVLLECDTNDHPITRALPREFVAPASEFYQWEPSPRLSPEVEVLLSISQKNYPLGIKDVVNFGDFPVVWTNKKFRMVYLNMGHGDEEFIDATQNLLFTNAIRWVVSQNPAGDPFKK